MLDDAGRLEAVEHPAGYEDALDWRSRGVWIFDKGHPGADYVHAWPNGG